MESKITQVNDLLCSKSATKQHVYKNTLNVFGELKVVLQEVERDIVPCMRENAPVVDVKYYDKGEFEAHLKFAGDTLVVMMHTNVFDFDDQHHIHKTKYVQDNPLTEYCGLIQIYNFLSDSLRYNREQDQGYLIGRIFINKDNHFFIDGKRPLSFLYSDIESNVMKKDVLRNIVEESILFCLNFDLLAPPLDIINYITVEQKNLQSYSSGIPTAKRLGFQMNRDSIEGNIH
jgi:hypothetical protein